MRRRLAILLGALTLAVAAAASAAADPSNGAFVIDLACNGESLTVVSIGQAHNAAFQVVGSTSVAVLVGLTAYDTEGNLVIQFLKPGHQHQQLTTCDFVGPGSGFGTAVILFTPAG